MGCFWNKVSQVFISNRDHRKHFWDSRYFRSSQLKSQDHSPHLLRHSALAPKIQQSHLRSWSLDLRRLGLLSWLVFKPSWHLTSKTKTVATIWHLNKNLLDLASSVPWLPPWPWVSDCVCLVQVGLHHRSRLCVWNFEMVIVLALQFIIIKYVSAY